MASDSSSSSSNRITVSVLNNKLVSELFVSYRIIPHGRKMKTQNAAFVKPASNY